MKSAFVILLCFFLTCPAWGDSERELKIIEEIFSLQKGMSPSIDLNSSVASDILRRPLVGDYLPEGSERTIRLLEENETTAIYEVIVVDQGVASMWSAFFRRTPLNTQLEALKGLNLPPYLAEVEYRRLASLKDRTSLQTLRLIQLQRLFMTTEEFKEDFKKNKAAYETIAKEVENGTGEILTEALKESALLGARPYGVAKSEGEIALLASKEKNINNPGGQIGCELGVSGFLDSILGLLHLPSGVSPPPISKKDYIFVEAINENWFLFRNISAAPFNDKGIKSGK